MRELARSGLSNVVRDRLLSEAAAIRAQIRALGEQKKADEESLARTPMVFNYGSGKTIPGFDEPQPLTYAFDRAGYNFLSAIGFLIVAVATLLPWVLLAWLAVWALPPRAQPLGLGPVRLSRHAMLPLETTPPAARRNESRRERTRLNCRGAAARL